MAETWDQGQNVSFLEPVRSWALIGDGVRREASQSESDVRNKKYRVVGFDVGMGRVDSTGVSVHECMQN